MSDATVLAILLTLSLVPPALMALWVRNLERRNKESIGSVMRAFGFGATIGVAIAFVLNTLFGTATTAFAADVGISTAVLTAVLIAPVVEEATKGLGMVGQRRYLNEPEDGLIHGAALGLGFAATENLLYGITALVDGGIGVAIGTLILRILSSMILHAGASALVGFGFGLVHLGLRSNGMLVAAYLTAALLHAAYNLLAVMETVLALGLALVLVWVVFGRVRKRIEALDAAELQE